MTGYDIELTATKWGILKFVMSDDFDEGYTLTISNIEAWLNIKMGFN